MKIRPGPGRDSAMSRSSQPLALIPGQISLGPLSHEWVRRAALAQTGVGPSLFVHDGPFEGPSHHRAKQPLWKVVAQSAWWWKDDGRNKTWNPGSQGQIG